MLKRQQKLRYFHMPMRINKHLLKPTSVVWRRLWLYKFWDSEGWLVLATPFTNTSMSKMPNISFSTCKSQKEPKCMLKTVHNKSESSSTIFFLSFTTSIIHVLDSGCKYLWLACSKFLSCHITWVIPGVVTLLCASAYPPTDVRSFHTWKGQ